MSNGGDRKYLQHIMLKRSNQPADRISSLVAVAARHPPAAYGSPLALQRAKLLKDTKAHSGLSV
jgi:hypothetical protein